MTRWRTRRRGSPHDRGAAAVEFAIVLVVLLLIIFAIIDFGRLLFASQAMKSASREGARTAVIQGSTGASVYGAAENAGAAGAALAGGDPLTVTAFPPNPAVSLNDSMTTAPGYAEFCGGSPGDAFELTASTPFTWFTPVGFFAQAVDEVRSTTTMRCE